MEEIAELDEASNLRCAVRGHRPAVVVTVVGKNTNAMSVHTGEARHLAAAPECADLKETALVDDVINQLPNLVGTASLARNDLKELLFAPVPLIADIEIGRGFAAMTRQVREKILGHSKRIRFVFGDVVDHAVAAVNLGAAELFLIDVLFHRLRDDGGAACEHLRGILRHDRKVGSDEASSWEAGAGA